LRPEPRNDPRDSYEIKVLIKKDGVKPIKKVVLPILETNRKQL